MAVYKATYCYPFLNSLDPRTVLDSDLRGTAKYLQCKIDTSNMDITGYSIRIIDENGNTIFPLTNNNLLEISPVSELSVLVDENTGENTGVNGTTLKIPFFQNYKRPILRDDIDPEEAHSALQSVNAIYYEGDIGVRCVLSDPYAQGWTYEGASYGYVYDLTEHEYPLIDGEYVMDGQLVFILEQGVFKLSFDKENNTLKLIPLDDLHDYSVVSLQGHDYQDTIFYYKEDIHQYVSGGKAGWRMFKNPQILDFDAEGHTYKWEITLYQGELENYPETTSLQEESRKGHIYRLDDYNDNHAYYVSYSLLDDKWFDGKLSAGQIMGSTPERIQISDVNMKEIPSGTATDPLVLQTRFIQLMNSQNAVNQAGSRVYISSYDATLGHIYPLQNSLSSAAVENAQYCRFYKHSNDAEYILNTDIVDFGISDEIYISNKMNGTSVTEEEIFIIGGSSIDPHFNNIAIGNTVLLTHVTHYYADSSWPQGQGIYTVLRKDVTITDGYGAVYQHCVTLKRAPGYQNWASYIGKVIYCAGGQLQGENMQCLASAGAFNLWDPRSASGINGSSPLLFIPEQPILLFNNKIYKTVTIYEEYFDFQSPFTMSSIDNYKPQLGDVILFRDNRFGEVTAINGNTYTLHELPQSPMSAQKYVYITQGTVHGGKVFYNNDYSTPNYDLFTAKVLRNDTTHTFISPYVGLKPGMKLKLLNNKKVQFTNGDASGWLDTAQIDTTLWYVSTATELLNPLESYNNMDKSVPWQYEVRSHYKASDENSFYCYETPYLNLKINDKIFCLKDNEINYITIDKQFEYPGFYGRRAIRMSAFYNQSENVSWNSYRFVLLDKNNNILQDTTTQYNNAMEVDFYGLTNEDDRQYTILIYVTDDLNNTLTYSVKLPMQGNAVEGLHLPFHAEYECDTHSVKLNLQDNGKVNPCYLLENQFLEKSIEVYDISNTNEQSTFDFSIDYLADNPLGNYGSDSSGWLHVTGIGSGNDKIPQTAIPVNLLLENGVAGNRTSRESGWVSSEEYYYPPAGVYQPSRAVTLGMNYGAFFSNDEMSLDEEQMSEKCLTLNNEANEFYFTSVFILTDNFCGDCVTVNVEGEYDEHHGLPILNHDMADDHLLPTNDFTGYLSFGLNIPDNFIEENGAKVLNPNRIHLGFFVDKDKYSETEERKIGYTNDYNFTHEPTGEYFYLQSADLVGPYINRDTEFLHFPLYPINVWFKVIGDANNYSNNKYLTSTEKFLGNCCVVCPNDDVAYTDSNQQSGEVFDRTDVSSRLCRGPIYWVEDRVNLKTVANVDGKFIDGGSENFALHYFTPSSHGGFDQYWPEYKNSSDEYIEEYSYWLEDYDSLYEDAPTWNDITSDHNIKDQNWDMREFIALPRHPDSLSTQEYKVEYRIFNIQAIYENWNHVHIAYDEYNGGEENLYGEVHLFLYNSSSQYFDKFAKFFIYYAE